ncbi:uncharacterized protein LAESUDRAFT_661269 [Laetiporus sulphureus 93-53]|uniref:Transmembrane protein 135 N-terminal domain-containing protein n=1 Tax=Laetiporus sulphureus 93-53 TaxID=1314785 RepID=A0A165CFI1_9APHY|nr:uncharacterized protein LAESUDRAFT_661269 [Laetiporus sulphureus 93-53]KZT02716.1 hypothetical protein LAESUDRAFT_661269 [Laetiporus sulphureus 93-53]
MSSPLSPAKTGGRAALARIGDALATLPNDHPVQVLLRTYALSLSLALGPAFLPFFTSAKARINGLQRLKKLLVRELSATGFACAMAVGVGGGAIIREAWNLLCEKLKDEEDSTAAGSGTRKLAQYLASVKDSHRTFLSYILSSSLAITLFHAGRIRPAPVELLLAGDIPIMPAITAPKARRAGPRPSITLDLTLLLLVRAMDALTQIGIRKYCEVTTKDEEKGKRVQEKKRLLRTRVDAMVFWACSARIIWCFLYEPERLPRSYNKWIMTLANIDPRILAALRALRSGAWSYRRHQSTQPHLLSSLSHDLGYPSAWGDVKRLPAYGGATANAAWQALGVSGRQGIGGIPCELVHGGVTGGSCTMNTLIRGAQAFASAFALYLPVHFLPILLYRPRALLQPAPVLATLAAVLRSASFLSTFVASIWAAVCLVRTTVLARALPWISHDFWDGPFGCTFAGSLVCGASIFVEQGRRRGEIALYVLPRAIRACLPERWVTGGGKSVKYGERIAFVLSLSTILTAATHRPDSLRGLSRWAVAFVMRGPNVAFWRRKRNSMPAPAPSEPKPVESGDSDLSK